MTKYILFPVCACDMIPPSIDVQITSRGLINCARTEDGRRKVLLCYVNSPVDSHNFIVSSFCLSLYVLALVAAVHVRTCYSNTSSTIELGGVMMRRGKRATVVDVC